ncbi:MAG: hypothetical protein ACRCYZ_05440, partial [Alphaproteobacteria bacterium]
SSKGFLAESKRTRESLCDSISATPRSLALSLWLFSGLTSYFVNSAITTVSRLILYFSAIFL